MPPCVLQSSSEDQDTRQVYSCVDLYFVTQVNLPDKLMLFLGKDSGCLPHLVKTCFFFYFFFFLCGSYLAWLII